VRFPSIEKFRNMLEQVPRVFKGSPPPTLTFRGTVKLHGTHADLRLLPSGAVVVQSRNRVLTVDADNDGCARFFAERAQAVRELLARAAALVQAEMPLWPCACADGYSSSDEAPGHPEGAADEAPGHPDEGVMIAGEFCGRGVQSKVAICRLPLMFVALAVRRGTRWPWIDLGTSGTSGTTSGAGLCAGLEAQGFHCIADFPTYALRVDLSSPEAALEEAQRLTLEIDRECPVALQLSGGTVRGPGEGIVWTCVERPHSTRLWFKTKGPTHTAPGPPKQPPASSIPGGRPAVAALAASVVPEWRLEQGLAYLREMGLASGGTEVSTKDIPAFVRWVTDDAFREERDAIGDSGVPPTEVRRAISMLACSYLKGFTQTTTNS
jgi:hypothetical protein